MRTLTSFETSQVTGAYAQLSTIGGLPAFQVTEDAGYGIWNTTVNGIYSVQDIIFLADQATDHAGNVLFSGHSGSFCHMGVSFTVTSIVNKNGVVVGNSYGILGGC